MAVSSSRMEYQEPDIREMREYAAARRSMSQEAYDQWASGSSSSYRADSSVSSSSTAASLPALEISSGEESGGQIGSQTGNQADSGSSRSSTDTSLIAGRSAGGEFGFSAPSIDDAYNVSDARGPQAQSPSLADRVSSSQSALASVEASQVQSGLQQGVFGRVQFGNYERPADVVNALQWLDGQIPRDGTVATEDRRTALLIATASAQAQLSTSDPVRQQELAYDYTRAIRDGITRFGSQLPEGMDGRRGDPDIAAAEHFFENSRWVSGNTLQIGDLSIPVPGLVSAVGMATADLLYQSGKRAGLISGSSQAGEFQTGWEFAGILRGLEARQGGGQIAGTMALEGWENYDYSAGGDDVDRIVITGDRISNSNGGTESGVGNVDSGTVSSGSGGAVSGIDSNGRADSGMLADGGGYGGGLAGGGGFGGGGGFDGGGFDSGGGGGFDGGGFDSGGGGGFDGGGWGGGGGGGSKLIQMY